MADAVDGGRSVQEAFALGWEVSRLHTSGRSRAARPPSVAGRPSLPGLSDLPSDRRTQIAIDSVDARLVRLSPVFAESRIRVPSTRRLRLAYDEGADEPVLRDAVRRLHLALLRALAVADPRLGTAYTLGRALHETRTARGVEVAGAFRFFRVLGLCQALDDLKGCFPAHAAGAVAGSLRRWCDWVASEPGALTGDDPNARQRVHDALLRQGDLWYGLLTGAQRGTDLLRSDDYLDAATALARESQRLLGRLVRRYAATLAVVAILVILAVAVAAFTDGVTEAAAAVLAVAGALGLTWRGVGTAIANLASSVREPLWSRQLDLAVESAIEQVSRLAGGAAPGRPRRPRPPGRSHRPRSSGRPTPAPPTPRSPDRSSAPAGSPADADSAAAGPPGRHMRDPTASGG